MVIFFKFHTNAKTGDVGIGGRNHSGQRGGDQTYDKLLGEGFSKEPDERCAERVFIIFFAETSFFLFLIATESLLLPPFPAASLFSC